MADCPLRACENGVVVGEDGAGGLLGAVLSGVDAGGPTDESVRRSAFHELFLGAAHALCRDREASVLDKAALVDELGEVLACGATAAFAPFGDLFGARIVGSPRLPFAHLGEIRPHIVRRHARSLA